MRTSARHILRGWCSVLSLLPLALLAAPAADQPGKLLSKEGTVDWAAAGTNWGTAAVGQTLAVRDRLRTQAASRAMVQLAELGRMRVDELTTLEILPPHEANSKATIDLKAGAMYFFTREKPREFLIQTPYALAASRGTELLVTLGMAGQAVFTVFDGEMELSNSLGSAVIRSGEQGAANPGEPPRKTAVLQMTNIVQWWLYYPAVLDPDELSLSAEEQSALADSASAYRQGDLLAALASYPSGRTPQSDAERIYLAAILLAAGWADRAEVQLARINPEAATARALREMIGLASLVPVSSSSNSPVTATEWLAESYVRQSKFDLSGALVAARAAAEKSPNFGFAWERVAELEFSQGRTDRAREALANALALGPRNAQAWALAGFINAAIGRWDDAQGAFDRAVRLDGSLGNG